MTITITTIAAAFTATVSQLCKPMPSGKNLFAATCNGRHLNFRHKDFEKALLAHAPKDSKRFCMKTFRDLGWIICGEKRFTNTQRIRGKVIRVVTIDATKYHLLLKLLTGMEVKF